MAFQWSKVVINLPALHQFSWEQPILLGVLEPLAIRSLWTNKPKPNTVMRKNLRSEGLLGKMGGMFAAPVQPDAPGQPQGFGTHLAQADQIKSISISSKTRV
jgi:hypothetical protein